MDQSGPIVVTAGEPAGIGPELCLSLAHEPLGTEIVVIADANLLRSRAEQIGLATQITEVDPSNLEIQAGGSELFVVHTPFPESVTAGIPNPANSSTLLDGLRFAARGCKEGTFAALVTAPIAKSVINDAGFAFSGHTEFLADETGAALPVMLLVAGELRVALATTHLPLRAVSDAIDQVSLRSILKVLVDGLQHRFGIAEPEIVVCGLNPHAGEGGHIGHEDRDIIAPVVDALVADGHRIRGPIPADTAFTAAAGHKDAVLAMYHDQGLPVLKYAGFGHGVNVTLGLPIVRTSVDHGTALDLAGSGHADNGSLVQAVRLAAELARR